MPLRLSTPASPSRSASSGTLTVSLLDSKHTGIGSEQQPGHSVQVDVAGDEVPAPATQSNARRVEDVGADDLRDRQRVDEHHHEPEEGAAAHRREADDEAEDGADRERDPAVAAVRMKGASPAASRA
jgi:hypothetical protein